MASQRFLPPATLGDYISDCVVSDFTNSLENELAYMYPIGSAVLCFSLDKACVFKDIRTGRIIQHAKYNFIHQFKQGYIYKLLVIPKMIIHIVFKPFGAYRLLGIPQNSNFDEHGTSLEKLLGPSIRPLLHKIEDAADNYRLVLQLIIHWLEDKLKDNVKENTTVVMEACQLIDLSNGNLSIEMLAKRMYLTPRVLQYKFQEQIGLSPKLYSRIIRFNKILKELAVHSLTDWQEIAINYNYCDQAHLIHDFKFFSGNSPAHQLKIRGIIN